jgi:hypothetical protein
MDNPTNVSSISGLSILDCRLVLSNVYLLPIVCHFSSMTNVSSISGLSILDCRSVLSNVYLLPIVCPVSCGENWATIKNEQSRDNGNIGHRRKMTYNR